MKSKIQCPHCDHDVIIDTSVAKLGAILGAVVGATSRRGLGLGGLLRGAAVGGGVAYVMSRFINPSCPGCSRPVATET
ncbi:MAG: hypothetical protein AAF721_39240 [Myxococcota bacterium]